MGTRLVSPGIPDFPLASDASTIDFRSDLRDCTSSATATGLLVGQRLREHRRESRVRNARLPASCALPNPSVCGGHLGRKPRFCFHRDSFTAPETHTSCRCPGLPVHPRDSAAQQQSSARDRHPETVSAETWAGEEKIPSFL
ncbi:hypothetical protein NN561_020269 [Cricetulus griseus]